MREQRKLNILINKAGGNSSRESYNYRLALPTSWAKKLNITMEDREIIATFNGKKIVIEKNKEEKEIDKEE